MGFVLAGGNTVKVWLALLLHAVRNGELVPAGAIQKAKPSTRDTRPTSDEPKCSEPRPAKADGKGAASPTKRKSEIEVVEIQAKWDNGSLGKATNLKGTAVHAAQGELVALGWLSKHQARNEQGQYGGFRYVLHQPPVELTEAARKHYAKKKDSLFSKAYEWESLLAGGEIVGGQCFSRTDLLAYVCDKIDMGKKMVIEEHLRGCKSCHDRLNAVKDSEREWGT